jgi:hypothetical protein
MADEADSLVARIVGTVDDGYYTGRVKTVGITPALGEPRIYDVEPE